MTKTLFLTSASSFLTGILFGVGICLHIHRVDDRLYLLRKDLRAYDLRLQSPLSTRPELQILQKEVLAPTAESTSTPTPTSTHPDSDSTLPVAKVPAAPRFLGPEEYPSSPSRTPTPRETTIR